VERPALGGWIAQPVALVSSKQPAVRLHRRHLSAVACQDKGLSDWAAASTQSEKGLLSDIRPKVPRVRAPGPGGPSLCVTPSP
jgi:hypothetical protein